LRVRFDLRRLYSKQIDSSPGKLRSGFAAFGVAFLSLFVQTHTVIKEFYLRFHVATCMFVSSADFIAHSARMTTLCDNQQRDERGATLNVNVLSSLIIIASTTFFIEHWPSFQTYTLIVYTHLQEYLLLIFARF